MEASRHLAAGILFAGEYRIERPLAEGGMGAVYVAEQLSTGQRRALKIMQPLLVRDERSRKRFLEEARIGSRIQSEHVVQVVDAGVDSTTGTPWLAMELLEGVDLQRYVQQHGPRPLDEVVDLLEQVAHALGDAHHKGIIHRDLKPENLFLARSHRRGAAHTVKILDFGIARTIAESRAAATVTSAVGSPMWMAPEQAEPGAQINPATDVWALGLISFYLLTGRSYWMAANLESFSMSALFGEIIAKPIEPASQRAARLGVHLDPRIDDFFARCVARDPSERFADANLAIAALRTAAGSTSGIVAVAPPQSFPPTGPAASTDPFAATGWVAVSPSPGHPSSRPPAAHYSGQVTPPPVAPAKIPKARSSAGLVLFIVLASAALVSLVIAGIIVYSALTSSEKPVVAAGRDPALVYDEPEEGKPLDVARGEGTEVNDQTPHEDTGDQTETNDLDVCARAQACCEAMMAAIPGGAMAQQQACASVASAREQDMGADTTCMALLTGYRMTIQNMNTPVPSACR